MRTIRIHILFYNRLTDNDYSFTAAAAAAAASEIHSCTAKAEAEAHTHLTVTRRDSAQNSIRKSNLRASHGT